VETPLPLVEIPTANPKSQHGEKIPKMIGNWNVGFPWDLGFGTEKCVKNFLVTFSRREALRSKDSHIFALLLDLGFRYPHHSKLTPHPLLLFWYKQAKIIFFHNPFIGQW
jgi:hypothetical protein